MLNIDHQGALDDHEYNDTAPAPTTPQNASGGESGAYRREVAATKDVVWRRRLTMWRVVLPGLYEEYQGRNRWRIVPTILTEKAVSENGTPRMSGQLLAYLDSESIDGQAWRALVAWDKPKAYLYRDFLALVFAGGPRDRGVSRAEMTRLARTVGRSVTTTRRWIEAAETFLYERALVILQAQIEERHAIEALSRRDDD